MSDDLASLIFNFSGLGYNNDVKIYTSGKAVYQCYENNLYTLYTAFIVLNLSKSRYIKEM